MTTMQQSQRPASREIQTADAIQKEVEAAINKALQEQGIAQGQPEQTLVRLPSGQLIAAPQAPLPPNTIVFPSDGNRPPVSINFDGGNIRFTQGANTTSIPLKDMVPRGAVQMSYAFAASVLAVFIGWPIARAIARYIDRRGRAVRADDAITAQMTHRFEQMERNIDTVALEMERLSEAQRFTSKLLEQRTAVPIDANR